ncbi:hypothetical protein OHA70_32735 [Kribbella sp. NBC_00382]|uniref:hypothetical protein n=1 Tax=Kribbella sp. NBC_00382 TaxID=2975967 RepID=UPI002E1D3E94
MGTQEEEAKARAELERVRTENAIKAMQRDEELRKLREQQQSKMVADTPQSTGQGWPDNEVESAPGRLTQIAGSLGVGKAGDAAFAKSLLDSGQPRAGSAGPAVEQADGAKSKTPGVRAAKPAFER